MSANLPADAIAWSPLSRPYPAAVHALRHPEAPTRPSEAAVEHGLTDAAHAERFAREYGTDLRFDHRRHRWLVYRASRWCQDMDGQVYRWAIEFVRARQADALAIVDRQVREQVVEHFIRAEAKSSIDRFVALAQYLPPVTDAGDGWDADPWLVGAPNGVIDLRAGELRAGDPADRITMCVGIPYDPKATCPRWTQFLDEIFTGNAEVIDFMHRAIGYSLSGETSEQCFFLCYGTGANGKGTLLNTLARVLNQYAWNMPFSTVELHQRAPIPNDLAALGGRRFVIASETNDGTRLNEARLKALTGCDPITARFLHAEFFTFQPVAKFWLAVNHKPIVRDDSHGFWRRVRLVPFMRTFGVSAELPGQLAREAPGILAWAVRGCLAWQRGGLQAPGSVIVATAEYARDSDPLVAFLEEACEVNSDAEIGASELYAHYRGWADRHGLIEHERLTATMFGRKVGERYIRVHTRGGGTYKGLARRKL